MAAMSTHLAAAGKVVQQGRILSAAGAKLIGGLKK